MSDDATSDYPLLTRRRNTDVVLLIALTALVLAGSLRLRVYYTVNALRVVATRALPDGSRAPVELPRTLERSGTPGGPLEQILRETERRIHRYIEKNPMARSYVWTIRYSVDHPGLERTLRVRSTP